MVGCTEVRKSKETCGMSSSVKELSKPRFVSLFMQTAHRQKNSPQSRRHNRTSRRKYRRARGAIGHEENRIKWHVERGPESVAGGRQQPNPRVSAHDEAGGTHPCEKYQKREKHIRNDLCLDSITVKETGCERSRPSQQATEHMPYAPAVQWNIFK